MRVSTFGYTQNSLEALARATHTRPGFLLEFNPLEDPEFWRAWLKMPERERREAIARLREFAKTTLREPAMRD